MEVRWPDWTVDIVLVYLVFLVVIAAVVWETKDKDSRHMWRTMIRRGLLAFVICCVALNGVVYLGGASVSSESDATPSELAGQFGLSSQTEYPLVLGRRLGGTEVSAQASGGLFTAQATVSTGPASALSVGFTHEGKSWVLELPVSQVTFVQSTSKPASLVLYLTNEDTYVGTEETYTRCKPVLDGLITTCLRAVATRHILVPDDMTRRGLPPIIAAYFDTATITLTPDMYRRMLG